MLNNLSRSEIEVLHIFIAFIFIILLTTYIIKVFVPFLGQRSFIKMEIGRSSHHERHIWQNRLKRLYVSLIPFIGPAIAEMMHKNHKHYK